jgi:putative phosphoesterase
MQLNRNADVVVHCGDSRDEIDEIRMEFPDKQYYCVKGNCDFGSMIPLTEEFTLEGVRFLACHGHMYNVKYGLMNLLLAAKERQADIALFGHTHRQNLTENWGVTLLNPGSAGRGWYPGYAVLTIRDGRFKAELRTI